MLRSVYCDLVRKITKLFLILVVLVGFSARATPVITEFLATNGAGLLDEDGSAQDWVELHNPGPDSVSLGGWFLTDTATSPTKWQFPAVDLPAGGYLVVFASGKNRTTVGQPLHTNFSLKNDGEYLGLIQPDGVTVQQQWSPTFPLQEADVSYGLVNSSNLSQSGYFSPPTPNAPNGPVRASLGKVDKPVANPGRGIYPNEVIVALPMLVTLTSATAGATIRYTLDGSSPTATTGTVYSSAFSIGKTSVVRAAAFKAGWDPSAIETVSYLVLDDVIRQQIDGSTPGPGWPSEGFSVNQHYFDYGMDEDLLAANPDVGGEASLKQALSAIPTVSLVTDLPNLFDQSTGIYVNPENRGQTWERACSLELINDPSGGFQIPAGVRIRGGFSRSQLNPKHSFHFYFRSSYGSSQLNYPLFGPGETSSFSRLDLRTTQNYSWSFEGDERNTFLREEFCRKTHAAMGYPASHVKYVHLYLNGVYWGLYDTDERLDNNFCATYLGGNKDDWDVVKSASELGDLTEASEGQIDAWNELYAKANPLWPGTFQRKALTTAEYYDLQGLAADGITPNGSPVLLDPANLIDYMLLTFWSGNLDGATSVFSQNQTANNWVGARNRTANRGFAFFVHDFEHTLLNPAEDRTGPYNLTFDNAESYNNKRAYYNPMFLHADLMDVPEYKALWQQRAPAHLTALLSAQPSIQRVQELASIVETAIIAESSRWGDARLGGGWPFTRQNWAIARDSILSYFPQRNAYVIDQLKSDGLYPTGGVEPPTSEENGLKGEYYAGRNFNTLVATRNDAQLDFDFGQGGPFPAMGSDDYSIRWQGRLVPQFSESYTFHLTSDDGVRLWINNQLVIDRWVDGGTFDYSGQITLQANQFYDIKVEYYDWFDYAECHLAWQSPSQSRQVIPASRLYPPTTIITPPVDPPPSSNNGLTGFYYDGENFDSLVTTRTDATIDFDFGQGGPFPEMGSDSYSIRWRGQIKPEFSELYTFYLTTDDGVRLSVNGQLLIDKWVGGGTYDYSGQINLTGGQLYEIEVEYFDWFDYAECHLSWQSARQPRQIVPAARLFPPSTTTTPPPTQENGLFGEYYTGKNFDVLVAQRKDSMIDFHFGYTGAFPAQGDDDYSIRWTGQLEVPSSNFYTFYLTTDDGARLSIDGQVVINQWVDGGTYDYSGGIFLTNDRKHDIKVEYYDWFDYAECHLSWQSPEFSRQIVPNSRLFQPASTSARSRTARSLVRVTQSQLERSLKAASQQGHAEVSFSLPENTHLTDYRLECSQDLISWEPLSLAMSRLRRNDTQRHFIIRPAVANGASRRSGRCYFRISTVR